MMRFFVGFLCIALIAIGLNSCSVEKRVHMRGYHVEWFGKKRSTVHDQSAPEQSTAAIIHEEKEIDSFEVPVLEDIVDKDLVVSNEQKSIDLAPSKKHIVVTNSENRSVPPVKWSEKKFEVFSMSSTALAIVAFVVPAELVLFFFLAAIIAGVIGLIRVLKNRDRFRGLMFAILGITVSLLMFVGLIVALSMFT
jgi:hypothetical protein